MKVLFILVCLPLFAFVNGHVDEGDWKKQFSILKSEFREFKADYLKKENEIDLLKRRVDVLERGCDDTSKQPTLSTKKDNIHGSNLQQKHSNADNKTLEERVEKLEELSKINVLRSCHEYAMYGFTASGFYQIDPDGKMMGHAPFEAYCDFEAGTTQLTHDKEFTVDIPHCAEPMCYELDLQYDGSLHQIQALKDISDTCTQDIRFDCFISALSANEDPIGVWLNKDGEPESYFVGAYNGQHICACGVNQNCSDSEHDYVCNCDAAQIPEFQRDEGIITNSSALPITGFRYGELKYEAQIAQITIGRMKCQGQKQIEPDKLMDSCANLWINGNTETGNYILNDQTVAFCEMSKQITDPDIQHHIGSLRYQDNNVM